MFGQLTWRRTSSSRGYMAVQKKRGRKGKMKKKQEDSGPVRVVQLVGVLLCMGTRRMGDTVRATVAATRAGMDDSRDRSSSISWNDRGDFSWRKL